MRENPYKYLDSYEYEDRDIFYGRERETQILLSDIAVSRLVVLFAKTGTGKTSLLNAGVRPILEEKGYAVCLIRVRKDPTESARKEIQGQFGNSSLRKGTLAAQLEALARELKCPLVLFFDQFEEFFLYQVKTDFDKAQQFIKDIAEIYNNEDSGVQIVFSMREEFFVNMDLFRDEIPTIFHYDSNLRLRWFDENQARRAIVRPAKELGILFEEQLLERLIVDLQDSSEGGRIEPTLLQITCDTLWKTKSGYTITLSQYLRMGKGDQRENIAREIFSNRLQDGFETFTDENLLTITRELLPLLRTEEGTKYVRSFDELLEAVHADKDLLLDLLKHLENINLIKIGWGDEFIFVELFHDYLVTHIDSIVNKISGIWPRRIMHRGMKNYQLNGTLMSRDDLERVALDLAFLKLDIGQADLLFRSALEHGIALFDLFKVAIQNGVDVWKILRDVLDLNDSGKGYHAISLLKGLREEPQAPELLKYCITNSDLAFEAVDALISLETKVAIDIVGAVLKDKTVGEYAQSRLKSFGNPRKKAPTGVYSPGAHALEVLANYQASKPLRVYKQVEPVKRSSDFDESHFKVVINALKEGRVVPFFGLGVNLCDRPDNTVWTADQHEYLPSGTELAEYLTDKFLYQEPGATIKCRRCDFENQAKLICQNCNNPIPLVTQDLPQVSQYVELMTGSAPLYAELHELFNRDYRITTAHHFFARLPSLLREKGYYPPIDEIRSLLKQGHSYPEIEWMMLKKHYSSPLLIVTTNYDDLMERAFQEAGEAFDLLWYDAHGKNRGKFLHKPAGEDKIYPIDRPKKYERPLLIQYPVILKINAIVKRSDIGIIEEDSYVITEDHYIDYLMRTEIANLWPAKLVAKLRRCHFLFLGYGLRDWNMRVLLHRISGEQKVSYRSWAIQRDFHEIDRQFWFRRNVDLYNERLDKYILELNQRLQAIDRKPTPANNSIEESNE